MQNFVYPFWRSVSLLLSYISVLLVVFVALRFFMQQPFAPINVVQVVNAVERVRSEEVKKALTGHLTSNLLSLDLSMVQNRLVSIPWVRAATVRRHFPDRLLVHLEEHEPQAMLAGRPDVWVNQYGEVFSLRRADDVAAYYPRLQGPTGSERDMLTMLYSLNATLAPVNLKVRHLRLSNSLAWDAVLSDGLLLRLGVEQPGEPVQERLARLVRHLPTIRSQHSRMKQIDLRYKDGVAIEP